MRKGAPLNHCRWAAKSLVDSDFCRGESHQENKSGILSQIKLFHTYLRSFLLPSMNLSHNNIRTYVPSTTSSQIVSSSLNAPFLELSTTEVSICQLTFPASLLEQLSVRLFGAFQYKSNRHTIRLPTVTNKKQRRNNVSSKSSLLQGPKGHIR